MTRTILCLLGSVLSLGAATTDKDGTHHPATQDTDMRTLHIKPRYARLYTDEGVPLAERNYQRVTLDWTVRLDHCAVVCVDCWAWHFSEETMARIDVITRERIAPLLAACRKQGMLVIHAPADPVASKHPNFVRLRPKSAQAQPAFPDSPEWPPPEFRSKTGPYARFARPHEPQAAQRAAHRDTQRDFHPAAKPEGDEPVILDGEDLHRLCAQRHILHLFFVGFNTNACIMMRDYGLPAMARRGYQTILLRDCTTGMEIADTVDTMTCTEGTIADIEQFLGYTLTSTELIQALSEATAKP